VIALRFNHAFWKVLNEQTLGVTVIDPDGSNIANVQMNRTFATFDAGGWSPVDGRKHVLVGRLDKYGVYNGPGDEMDINLHIDPNPMHRFLLDNVVEMMQGSLDQLLPRQDGNGFVIEAEITPDEEYWDNPWFPVREGATSFLVGSQIGVYGAYVRDWSHKGRPEIHPCEVIWFRTRGVKALVGAPSERRVRWTVIVMQDDSERFSQTSHFDLIPPPDPFPPVLPRPWAASPRRARIRFALLGLRGEHLTYTLRMNDGRRVAEWPGEDTRSVTVTAPGGSAVTVTKVHSRRRELKVRLDGLFPDPDDSNLLQCLMTLDLQVGEGDNGQEGFAEVSLEVIGPGYEPPLVS
jgi:hypothetical protein